MTAASQEKPGVEIVDGCILVHPASDGQGALLLKSPLPPNPHPQFPHPYDYGRHSVRSIYEATNARK